MELSVTVPGKKTKQKLEASDAVFGGAFNEALVHQVVTAYLAGGRQGTAAQKTRSEVRGGGKKPWRQKGTGRARAGTIRSPIWRSGGVTFASKTRDYSQKVNKKMYRGAIRSILSELVRQERLIVLPELTVDVPKTKALIEKLSTLAINDALIVTDEVTENLCLAASNIPNVDVRDVSGIDPVSLVQHENVIVTEAAVKQLEAWLA